MKDTASSSVKVTYYSNCLGGGPPKQTNKCTDLKVTNTSLLMKLLSNLGNNRQATQCLPCLCFLVFSEMAPMNSMNNSMSLEPSSACLLAISLSIVSLFGDFS